MLNEHHTESIDTPDHSRLGIAGSTAKQFLTTEITPLLALVGLLLGIFAVLVTPREEEPQINVTFANVFIPYPGASAREVEQVVSTPAEQKFSEIEGLEHVYSVSYPGLSILTIQFKVGEDRTSALVRLYNAVYSNQDWLPAHLGVGQPLVKPKGIDDVPIVTLTLWTDDPKCGACNLQKIAHTIEAELKRVKGTRDIYTIGGSDAIVRVLLDPVRLTGYGLTIDDLRYALSISNAIKDAGSIVRDDREILVQAGTFLTQVEEVANLVVGMHNGHPVYLSDVATVEKGTDQVERYVSFHTGPALDSKGIEVAGDFPAVTVAIGKQPGTNAVEISRQVTERFEQLRGTFIPDNVQVTVTRDYGETANSKAQKLISKLIFATLSVVLLVLLALGWREAIIVGAAVVITLLITLFASWAWGFTLNRVSLFALIFSIGILVDDAIVVVENIHRHMQMGKKNLLEAIPLAVDEVGGPTILATFTVIAALLPMAFVTGLMGPYMSPIPINASFGMLISLAVAFIFTPWLSYKFFKKIAAEHAAHGHGDHIDMKQGLGYRFFNAIIRPFLKYMSLRWLMLFGVLALIVGSMLLAVTQHVVLKMLPFDNKSEFQIVVDMPEGTSVEHTARVLNALGEHLKTIPEVSDYQIYAGMAAPINFNGLVRQYYLRKGAIVGDIQVNLVDAHHRSRKSHEIAFSVREPLQAIGRELGANVKIVEVPPGPPVQAPLVAEVYGLDYEGQLRMAKAVRQVFENTKDIVDVDDSVESPAPKLIIEIDQAKAARLGVSQQTAVTAINTVLRGEDVTFLYENNVKYPIPIRLTFAPGEKAEVDQLQNLRVRSQSGHLIALSEFAQVRLSQRENAIYHKDLLPIAFVTGDMAGKLDSPLYGMFDIFAVLKDSPIEGYDLQQYLFQQPENPYRYSIKWDGEWQVTFETFRDMGIAYAIGMILIYLLVVAQFRSYLVPLIIMAPIPLTIIGVMPGHALLGAQFTATSMIGMIALAGIIVRNSILLVDFINQQVDEGMDFADAVVNASAVRAKPIVLTGLAAMLGAFFILDDPIFSGLAVALIFGIFVSTLLTLIVIPVMYYAFTRKRFMKKSPATPTEPPASAPKSPEVIVEDDPVIQQEFQPSHPPASAS
ncbi:efflux RND transporter permease subunit [Thioflexithrix psekupsensis]|uniref:efflux RND transporter permease subunit n=1 Tax=Thioflexithrix psekupsensis TaxID=1570016 RepID=UPI000A3B9B71|nr:efflux RND transporter permease subunit [Thioflexithrix psekupsensis]